MNNTNIIEDISILPFTMVKISISKNYSYYFIKKLYKVKDCKNNSVVLDKKIDVTLQQYTRNLISQNKKIFQQKCQFIRK